MTGDLVESSWAGVTLGHDPSTPGALRPDTVIGPNPTTRTLAAITVRRRVRRALDVGTGCGALALLAARHADEVVATDVSERALEVTAANAARNRIANVECRLGDRFAPVAGERFDLITANLPYVVSPDVRYTFRDAGLAGDDVSRTGVEGAAGVLADGGFAHLLVNWLVTDPQRQAQRVVEWLRPLGCRAVVLHHGSHPARDYAERWNRTTLADRPDELAATVDRWEAYLGSLGAVGVASGAVVLHRASPAWAAVAHVRVPPAGSGGAQVARILTAPELDDDTLLASPLAVPAHRWVEEGGRFTIVAEHTCGVVVTVDRPGREVVSRLDGAATVAEVADTVHAEHGVDPARARAAAIDAARLLVRRGLATVVSR